jgi:hypothetical protein
MRALVISGVGVMMNLALNVTLARWGGQAPGWLIVSLWLLPLAPLIWWLYTHERVKGWKIWLRDRYTQKPKGTVTAALVALLIVCACIPMAIYEAVVRVSSAHPHRVTTEAKPAIQPPPIPQQQVPSSRIGKQTKTRKENKESKAAQDNSVHVESGGVIQQQSGGNCSPNIVGGSNTVNCGPPPPRISFSVNEEVDSASVWVEADGPVEFPAFWAKCDRPCYTRRPGGVWVIGNPMSGYTLTAKPSDPTSAEIIISMPRPLGAHVRVKWTILANPPNNTILRIVDKGKLEPKDVQE